MKEDERPKPQLHKIVVVLDGERLCYMAFADAAQEKEIERILFPPRYPN
mgnify:CR=1 FL=1